MVEVNLRELLKEYVVATIAAANVYLAIDKLPGYLKRIGEDREKRREEYQLQLFDKVVGPMQKKIDDMERELQAQRAKNTG